MMEKFQKILIALLVGILLGVGTGIVTRPSLSQKIQQEIKKPQEELIEQINWSRESVVHLQCPMWQGSGFVVAHNLIMTARHCVEGVEDFTITTQDGHKLHATRAISDKEHDVAFIYVDDLTCVNEECSRNGFVLGPHSVRLKPAPLGSINQCKLGDPVYVIGSPYGKQLNFNTVTTGIISGKDRDWSSLGDHYGWKVAFTTDAAGHPGNSGCPVFSEDGVVRGILVGGFSPVLIDVMPCDLFLSDLEEIRLMFVQDRYEREQANGNPYGYEYYGEWKPVDEGYIIESKEAGVEGHAEPRR